MEGNQLDWLACKKERERERERERRLDGPLKKKINRVIVSYASYCANIMPLQKILNIGTVNLEIRRKVPSSEKEGEHGTNR